MADTDDIRPTAPIWPSPKVNPRRPPILPEKSEKDEEEQRRERKRGGGDKGQHVDEYA